VQKFSARTICKPILNFFNLAISSSVFPTIWKDYFIIPPHKTGAKVNVQNCRGISKWSAIPKTFERIITSHLHRLCSSLISPCQHGFVKRRSTTTYLLELTSFVIDGFNKKIHTDVIYTDFCKAFDSVNHSLLLFKLDQLAFSNNLLAWISSYLNGRSKRVLFKNAVSKMINVISGVPQGSQ